LSGQLLELIGGYSHDVWVDGGALNLSLLRIAPHLRLGLVQFAPTIFHHLYDMIEHVAVPALKLDANHFHITFGALQSFHLFYNIKSIVYYKIYWKI